MATGIQLGDPVEGQTCPRCHRCTVVYNGNYFCTACQWVMGERGNPKRIIKAYLTQQWVKADKAGNVVVRERMAFYLQQGGFVDEVVTGG